MKYKFDIKDQIISNFDIYSSSEKLIEINKNEDDIRKFIFNKISYRLYFVNENGKIDIYKSGEEISIHTFILNHDGLLIGVDHGEFGGSLIYKNFGLFYNLNDVLILDDNIQFIFSYKNKIMILSGLSHLGSNRGSLYELDYNKDYMDFKLKNKIELGSEPAAYTIYNDKIYITTYRSIIIINNGVIENKYDFENWFSLYPNSIYVNNDDIIIGTNGCILIFNINFNDYKLYGIKKTIILILPNSTGLIVNRV
jgi:hypothetical protein